MTINNKYQIGETVYLRTDEDQKPYFVTWIHVNSNGHSYTITNNGYENFVFEFEISNAKDALLKLGIEKQ